MFSFNDFFSRISSLFDPPRSRFSKRSAQVRESNIRDAARLVAELKSRRRVINLGQGLPEFPAPQVLKDAACAAIQADCNQYSNTWGYTDLREAIARKMLRFNGIKADPETEVTVTCGVSEGLHAALLAIVDPDDEVIIIEPFYENYLPDVVMTGGVPRYVRLRAPDFRLDERELAAAFNRRTKAILLTNPHNPTGRVFSREELEIVARLCTKWGVVALSDEIYEHMVYDGRKHVSLATVAGMEDRTITLSGLSKTFSVTGWRLGYLVAPSDYSSRLRKLHDYIALAAPSPLQRAALVAMDLPDSFYAEMNLKYQHLRDRLCAAMQQTGLEFRVPEGTYYLFADAGQWGFANDRLAWEHLLFEFGLVTVAGYCFHRPGVPTNYLRFCFAKRSETIDEAAAVLQQADAERRLVKAAGGRQNAGGGRGCKGKCACGGKP